MLSTVWEGVKYAKANANSAESVLVDCYAAINTICETLESGLSAERFAEYNNSLDLLKAMFEFLFDSISENKSTAEVSKDIKEQIKLIKKELKNESEIKLEMVFFPYKASMWDSLESIWLAAKDDPDCDAYVVPIPYYERNPDGSFGLMKYEGEQYPDYVPVVDWRKYNPEERCPDAIFIHNAYDGDNFITSVHPDYYASRLCKFTDMLVFSPYFVCNENISRHFCIFVGTPYIDRVIVQSERIRQTCISVYKEFEKKNNIIGKFGKAEEKFVALGSPKFDKAINARREDYNIPDDWKRLIEKPDGTKKKVVLYNTSVTALLNGNEKALYKLRATFDFFKGRDDVVLLWRPHPLSFSAFKSMRPKLAKEYLDIVNEYRRQGFGIYDDSEDLHRAISSSDIYCGDVGSLIPLYACTGNPLILQNISVNVHINGPIDLPVESIYDDGDNYWFVVCNFSILFKMAKDSFQVEFMGLFPNEAGGRRLYSHIEAVGERLYFAPYEAKEIGVYNTKSNQFEKAPADKSKLPKMFTDRSFDVEACRKASEDFINRINPACACKKDSVKMKNINNCLFCEFSFANLPDYLNFILSDDNAEYMRTLRNEQLNVFKRISENADGTCGVKTYEYIKTQSKGLS